MDHRVEVAASTRDALGETPIWLQSARNLAWIDAIGVKVHVLDVENARIRTFHVDQPGPLGGIARGASEGRIILAAPGVIGELRLETGAFTPLLPLDAARHDIVCNDAKVDARGDLWVGTCERAEQAPRGALYRIGPEGAPALFDAGFVVPNGPAFARDGRTIYVSDTMAGRILAYPLDAGGVQDGPRRVFADLSALGGLPDGLTIDDEDHLWCALWSGGGIARFAPSGELVQRIALPATNVTSLAFGGDGLTDLYVTTARTALDPQALADEPLAGSLFRVQTGARGVPERAWAGLGHSTLSDPR